MYVLYREGREKEFEGKGEVMGGVVAAVWVKSRGAYLDKSALLVVVDVSHLNQHGAGPQSEPKTRPAMT